MTDWRRNSFYNVKGTRLLLLFANDKMSMYQRAKYDRQQFCKNFAIVLMNCGINMLKWDACPSLLTIHGWMTAPQASYLCSCVTADRNVVHREGAQWQTYVKQYEQKRLLSLSDSTCTKSKCKYLILNAVLPSNAGVGGENVKTACMSKDVKSVPSGFESEFITLNFFNIINWLRIFQNHQICSTEYRNAYEFLAMWKKYSINFFDVQYSIFQSSHTLNASWR